MVNDFANDIPLMQYRFCLHANLWTAFESNNTDVINGEWKLVKFMDNGEIHDEMDLLPRDKGGIYAFYAKPHVMNNDDGYLLYIGRAKFTENHNLWKRCRRYHRAEKVRPKIERMVDTFSNSLYIKYIEVEDNNLIEDIEKELINCLLPPCNDEIPNKDYQRKIKAF